MITPLIINLVKKIKLTGAHKILPSIAMQNVPLIYIASVFKSGIQWTKSLPNFCLVSKCIEWNNELFLWLLPLGWSTILFDIVLIIRQTKWKRGNLTRQKNRTRSSAVEISAVERLPCGSHGGGAHMIVTQLQRVNCRGTGSKRTWTSKAKHFQFQMCVCSWSFHFSTLITIF